MSIPTKFVSLIATIALGAAACSSSHHASSPAVGDHTATAGHGTWIGKVDGTNALVAVVSDGVEVTVYACDGKTISTWFRGLANGGHPQLVNDSGARIDAALAADKTTGTLTNAAGKQFSFTATPGAGKGLYRADASVKGKQVLGGWILGANGEQRGAINVGPSILPAPSITLSTTPQITTVTIPGVTATLTAVPQAPDNIPVVTHNTTGFADFVIAGMGDSYSAGEGNPFKPANLPVAPTATVWDKLLAGAVFSGGEGWALLIPGLNLAGIGLPALAAATHLGHEDMQPEVTGIGEKPVEQWGGSADSPGVPHDEGYRVLCHQGKSPSEKAFDDLSIDPKYSNVVHFVYWNFACAGSQTRHLFKEPYDGDPDHSRSPNPLPPDAVPPQLDLLRAALGDQSSTTAATTARTFLTNKRVPFFTDQQGSALTAVPHVDALYFSSGGNDIGFARVIMDCGILPLPDCGDGTDAFGPLNEEKLVQNGGDVNSFDPANFDSDLHHDNVFPGIKALPTNYSDFNQALRQLQVVRDGVTTSAVPNQVYMAEGPNPLHKTVTTLCDGSEGPLHNDLVGLLSATDVRYADHMAKELNTAIDAGAQAANNSPLGDGTDHWNIVPLGTLFFGHAICTSSRFTMTGGDALAQTGNDLGVDGLFEAADGTAHPNDDGYTAMAGVFEQKLRAQLDTMIATPPAKPTRLRQVSAVQNGAIGVRWDDNANNGRVLAVAAPARRFDRIVPAPAHPADLRCECVHDPVESARHRRARGEGVHPLRPVHDLGSDRRHQPAADDADERDRERRERAERDAHRPEREVEGRAREPECVRQHPRGGRIVGQDRLVPGGGQRRTAGVGADREQRDRPRHCRCIVPGRQLYGSACGAATCSAAARNRTRYRSAW